MEPAELVYQDKIKELENEISKLKQQQIEINSAKELYLKILVAEDELENYYLNSTFLEETGIQITHALNGKKAVELASNSTFDVILMDIKMPIMDGFEATHEIRKINNNISIIAQSAYAYKREECINSGFTDYLAKPFNKERLVRMIEQYIVYQ